MTLSYEGYVSSFGEFEAALREVQELARRRHDDVVPALAEAVKSAESIEETTAEAFPQHAALLKPLFEALIKQLRRMLEAAQNGRRWQVVWGTPDAVDALRKVADATLAVARVELGN